MAKTLCRNPLCRRPLRDPASIALGVGPLCAKRLGLAPTKVERVAAVPKAKKLRTRAVELPAVDPRQCDLFGAATMLQDFTGVKSDTATHNGIDHVDSKIDTDKTVATPRGQNTKAEGVGALGQVPAT